MNEILIKNTIGFLERTTLKGNEVGAYIEIINFLKDELEKLQSNKK